MTVPESFGVQSHLEKRSSSLRARDQTAAAFEKWVRLDD